MSKVCPPDCPDRCADPNCHDKCENYTGYRSGQETLYKKRKTAAEFGAYKVKAIEYAKMRIKMGEMKKK